MLGRAATGLRDISQYIEEGLLLDRALIVPTSTFTMKNLGRVS